MQINDIEIGFIINQFNAGFKLALIQVGWLVKVTANLFSQKNKPAYLKILMRLIIGANN